MTAPERLFVRQDERIIPVPTEEIIWIEAAGDYSKVHAAGQIHLHGLNIGSLEQKLDPARFVHVHRSAIIALSRLQPLVHDGQGGYVAVLEGQRRVRASRSYAARVRGLMR